MIEVRHDGGLLTLTLNRPEKANALTAAMLADLESALAGPPPAALILTGAGRVFSAGADLEEMQAGLGRNPAWERVSSALAALPCPTIAALNGTLAGGAMGLALACDMRLAVTGAKLFYPVMRLGFLPQPSDPLRLAALIGPARAKMILLAGARIEAEEAQAWGLIERICPPEALMATARALMADALAAKAEHRAAIKAMFEKTAQGCDLRKPVA